MIAGNACTGGRTTGSRALFGRLDVTSKAGGKGWTAAAVDRLNHIGAPGNNASSADHYSYAFRKRNLAPRNGYLSIHLAHAFVCSKRALPALARSAGAIVRAAYTRASWPAPDTEDHVSSHGLTGLTHAIAISKRPQVRIDAILAGSPLIFVTGPSHDA